MDNELEYRALSLLSLNIALWLVLLWHAVSRFVCRDPHGVSGSSPLPWISSYCHRRANVILD